MKGKRKGSQNVFKHTNCDICNKTMFILNKDAYVYKLYKGGKLKYYCSYSCWRKAGGY